MEGWLIGLLFIGVLAFHIGLIWLGKKITDRKSKPDE
jgi:hypothetical protein